MSKQFCTVRKLRLGEHPAIKDPQPLDAVVVVAGEVMNEHWAEGDPIVVSKDFADDISQWWNERAEAWLNDQRRP